MQKGGRRGSEEWEVRLQFVEHCSSTKDFWICRFVDKNCVDKNSTKRHFFLTVQSKSLQNHFIFFGQDDLSDDDTDEEEPSESESVDMNATILQSSTSVEKILAKIRKAVRAILNILCSLFVRFCRQKTSFFRFSTKINFREIWKAYCIHLLMTWFFISAQFILQ